MSELRALGPWPSDFAPGDNHIDGQRQSFRGHAPVPTYLPAGKLTDSTTRANPGGKGKNLAHLSIFETSRRGVGLDMSKYGKGSAFVDIDMLCTMDWWVVEDILLKVPNPSRCRKVGKGLSSRLHEFEDKEEYLATMPPEVVALCPTKADLLAMAVRVLGHRGEGAKGGRPSMSFASGSKGGREAAKGGSKGSKGGRGAAKGGSKGSKGGRGASKRGKGTADILEEAQRRDVQDPCLHQGPELYGDLERIEADFHREEVITVGVRLGSRSTEEVTTTVLPTDTGLKVKQRLVQENTQLYPEEVGELSIGGTKCANTDLVSDLGIEEGAHMSLSVSEEAAETLRLNALGPLSAFLGHWQEKYQGGKGKSRGKDIGQWGMHTGLPGTELLDGGTGGVNQQRAVFEAFLAERRQKHPNGIPANHAGFWCFPELRVLQPDACKALKDHVDTKHAQNPAQDFKLDLSVTELIQLVGSDTVAALRKQFGGTVHDIKVRRAEPCGHCINFHLDYAVRTMQIPLNGASEYEGGRLVYATHNGLMWPARDAGSVTVHDNTVPHGVSTHTSGVRYGLFFLEQIAH